MAGWGVPEEKYKQGEAVYVHPLAEDRTGYRLFLSDDPDDKNYGFEYSPPYHYDGTQSDGDLRLTDSNGDELDVSPAFVTTGADFRDSLRAEGLAEWEVDLLSGNARAIWLGSKKDGDDPVHHPSHYQSESGLEAIEVIEAFELNYRLGNAQKYLLRAGKKGSAEDAITDLSKAVFYIEREIEKRKEAL